MTEKTKHQEGLQDIVACKSSICRIDLDEERGILEYRGYDIHDLAKNSNFEEVTYLLLFGELPSKKELELFSEELKERRELPPQIIGLLTHLPQFTHPMVVLRTAISYLGSMDKYIHHKSYEKSVEKAKNLVAKLPTITAYYHRIRTGQNLVGPNMDLDHSSNFLYMLHGEEPTETEAKSLDLDLILHADHELNASTFAARTSASTLADIYACVVAGTGALMGPLHGGASQKVMETLKEVAVPWRAEDYIKEKLEKKGKIMGFGHRVYRKVMDPRTIELKALSKKLADEKDPKWFEISEATADAVYKYKGLLPNVDFYSASVYANLNIPDDLFINIFAMSRISGWTSHVVEQYENNKLIRPRAEYVGPESREYQSFDGRNR